MFTKKSAEKSGLEEAIDEILSEMKALTSDDEAYAKMVDQLEKLYKLKAIDKPDRPSADTLALIAGNLAGILVIVGYEHTNVITSKALNFLFKLR